MTDLHGISEGRLMGLTFWHVDLFHHFPLARVEEVWAIFDPMGWMSHGKTCPLGAGTHLSLYSSSTTPLYLTYAWIHYEIYLLVSLSWTLAHPAPRSFCHDHGRGFSGPPQPSGYINTPVICASFSHIWTDFQSLERKEHR